MKVRDIIWHAAQKEKKIIWLNVLTTEALCSFKSP